jgi:pimeloyl-ACP methyl ester carboxylesterase
MLSLKHDEISLKQNNNNCFNRLEKQSLSPSDEQDKEIKKKLKWYDNRVLQADDSSRTMTTTTYSTLCTSLWSGLLIIVLLPIILVGFILILIFWILPGFGWLYEKYAEARDRKKYYPPIDEMKPWGPDNQLIHVVHLVAPGSNLPPIVYVSGLGASMYIVKLLLLEFVEYMGEPVEMVSFDSPGYGASEPPTDWNTHSAETELSLLRRVVEELKIRKPFILFGASAGASLAQLYRLTHPEDVAGIVLFDPTPSNVFEQGSPMASDFNRAFSLYGKMARAASWGLIRPLIPLMRYCITGEFGDIFRLLPPSHVALFMTKTMLLKTGNHFRYWRTIMDYILKLQNDDRIRRKIPLLVISALNWTKNRPHGGLTREEMRRWWNDNQQPFVRSSDNAGFVPRTDYTHAQCMLDIELATNAVKAILTQIHSEIVQ